jgi:hypothetical protein
VLDVLQEFVRNYRWCGVRPPELFDEVKAFLDKVGIAAGQDDGFFGKSLQAGETAILYFHCMIIGYMGTVSNIVECLSILVYLKKDDGLDWKAPMRVLPCLAPSDIHTVLSSVSKTHQSIAYSSFQPKPSSSHSILFSYAAEQNGLLRSIQLACASLSRLD